MNPALYCLAVSTAACRVAGVIMYTIGIMVVLSPVKNCHTILATEVLPAASVFHCSL